MTRRFKVVAILITIITLSVSTYCGVLASQKLSGLSLGTIRNYSSLDALDGNVGMVNVLLIGVDDGGYRSDTIMLASLDGYSNRVSILSIPRDTMVTINGTTQKINATMGIVPTTPTASPSPKPEKNSEPTPEPTPKLSQAELDALPSKLSTTEGHEDLLINKVKSITGLPVHYFVTVDFDGFMDVIEAVDGVEFNVPYDMDYDDPVQGLHIHLEAGQQHLTGQLAHDFVRFRHNNDGSAPGEYVMGDEGRMYWQQQFLKELIKQKLNAQYLSKIDDVYAVFQNNVRTNLTMTEIMRNLNALMNVNLDDITSYQLPGDYEYTNNLWYYVHSERKTEELVNNVFRPQSREEWESYLEKQAAESSPEPDSSSSPSSDDKSE